MFFFESWTGLGRVVLIGTLAYIALIVLLRISGKRTLSKMNAFDLVVTVAFGSTLATVLLSKSVPLAEGVTAFALLVVLQLVITWLSARSNRIQQLVKAQPALLLYRGRLLRDAMRRERVTEEEIRAAVRSQGIASLDDVDAVVIETEGTISVMSSVARKVEGREQVSTLATVRGWPADEDAGERAADEKERTV